MNFIQPLKILVVSLVLLTPGLWFVFTGPVPGFEQKQQTEFPRAASVFLPSPVYRVQMADAIFERSAARRFSIQTMNALHLYGFGFIDTAGAISGTGRWLFYKPQFRVWDCDRHQVLQRKLDRFTLINQLLTASDIPLVFALAPNKASIEREHLGGRTSRYLECYFKFEQQFTAATSNLNPRYFVDHSNVLSDLPAGQSAYLQFDTHWTQASAVDAMNQLFESRPGVLGIPLYDPETRSEQAYMDILNLMLLLEHEETMTVPVSVKPAVEEIEAAQLASNVLFIHDSFYGRILPYLRDRSPNAYFQQVLAGDDVPVRKNLDRADVVVVEMIQRDFLDFIWSDSIFGWGSIFAEWMLDEMAVATRQCNWASAEDLLSDRSEGRTVMRNVQTPGEQLRMKGSQKSRILFRLPDDMAPGRVCLRLQLDALDSGAVKLYFSAPGANRKQPGYSGAMMVSKRVDRGRNTLALVLPEAFRGRWLRLDPIDHDGEFTIHTLDTTSFD